MGMRRNLILTWGALAALAGCTAEPAVVASNCDDGDKCVSREALKIDAVDILLVIDDSASTAQLNSRLKSELPSLLNAITMGDADDGKFPPATSVHVAVTTTDLGSGEGTTISGCEGWGRDGTFVKPNEYGLTCEVDYPGYLAFEGGPAAVATANSVGCVPLVIPQDPSQGGPFGCGFEQPLEESLKALLPSDSDVRFVHGTGHGDDENAGFLRENSLLVVVVVSDEDDCSMSDYASFDPQDEANLMTGLNVACQTHADRLYEVQRYVDALRSLRPHNDNVIFGAIAGVPAEMVEDEFRANFDMTTDAGIGAYYDAVLADPRMEEQQMRVDSSDGPPWAAIAPSCTRILSSGERLDARPPRRLVETAKAFGARGVIGSLCEDDPGAMVGHLIRTIGEQLTAANAD
jgi:hypothetical protein